MKIVFLGAGSIGCFVGGCWQVAGMDVVLIGRSAIADQIAENGLNLSDHTGWSAALPSTEVNTTIDPAAMSKADLVVVAVKSTATHEAGALIARHAPEKSAILSLQNGISNVELLQQALPEHSVLAGMVGFNVVRLGDGRWHKATSGEIICQRAVETGRIAERSSDSASRVHLADDMEAIAWGKLLLNLNNAINALSGLKLIDQLSNRNYRRVLSASMREALSVLDSALIEPAKITPLPPRLLPRFIDTPDWFFKSVGLRLQKIDPQARSSMADDLAAGKTTEIDYLNGEIVKLAEKTGQKAPVNEKIVQLVHQAETGGQTNWGAKELVAELLL
ncbi:MAG: 2-dehydropantoate 2-reductase [Rhizobiaceae bacterium]